MLWTLVLEKKINIMTLVQKFWLHYYRMGTHIFAKSFAYDPNTKPSATRIYDSTYYAHAEFPFAAARGQSVTKPPPSGSATKHRRSHEAESIRRSTKVSQDGKGLVSRLCHCIR